MKSVTSPPSSTTSCGPLPSGNEIAWLVYHQYSSSDSPFHAKTGTPAFAIAAAAWSWVEKILHEAQRTLAPRSISVSINTAVWIVMWSEPVMRTPASGFWGAYFSRIAINPGISFSAIEISFRPKSASDMSLTLKSCFVFVFVLIINLFRRLFQRGGLVRFFPSDLWVIDFAEVTVVRRL